MLNFVMAPGRNTGPSVTVTIPGEFTVMLLPKDKQAKKDGSHPARCPSGCFESEALMFPVVDGGDAVGVHRWGFNVDVVIGCEKVG
ncbi:hypothetical protein ZHAS_00017894 [Anopheles sinensis]|uniref:Uncharacterized protein n=1 Tax=Anopheles sinensis TaxID=74873 RepID=A0A084WI24_ANOSI|nr:hypothetical protein ZHAS_00017894 [Anopheles sinensis]